MARALRLEYQGAYYHVMNRGAGHKQIFHNDTFYHLFLDILEEAKEDYGVEIHAYCLMGNHYHLLLETPRGNLSKVMKYVNGVYTLRHNRMLKCDGSLFRGRYKAILVDADNYLLHVSRYIHLNPVTAYLVENPRLYRWSSYQYYCMDQGRLKWINYDGILNHFKSENKSADYSTFVDEGIDLKTHKIYSAAKTTPIYGDDAFCNKIREKLKITPHYEVPESKKEFNHQTLDMKVVVKEIAKYYGCQVSDIVEGRNEKIKKIAIYFCRRLTNETQTEIGKYISDIRYTAVSLNYKKISKEFNNNEKLNNDRKALEVIFSNFLR